MSSVLDHHDPQGQNGPQPQNGPAPLRGPGGVLPSAALVLDDVSLEVGDGGERIRALDHVDLQVEAGERRDLSSIASAALKAGTLVEALPWLERYQDALVVVKYGGNAMTDPALKKAFAEDIAFL